MFGYTIESFRSTRFPSRLTLPLFFPPSLFSRYAEMRRESITCGGIPIAVRHIESIMRMSEARYVIRREERHRERC